MAFMRSSRNSLIKRIDFRLVILFDFFKCVVFSGYEKVSGIKI